MNLGIGRYLGERSLETIGPMPISFMGHVLLCLILSWVTPSTSPSHFAVALCHGHCLQAMAIRAVGAAWCCGFSCVDVSKWNTKVRERESNS